MKKIIKLSALAAALLLIFTNAALAANNTVSISGWGASFWAAPDGSPELSSGKTGVEIIMDPDIVAEGQAALHVFAERDMDNLNAQAAQNISALEAGKTYRLTGKFNAPRTSWRFRLMFGNQELVQIGNIVEELNTWCDVDYTFQYVEFTSKEFRIQACGGGDIYADALSLKEVLYDADGETIIGYGEELLVNGDFEDDLDLTPPGEITDLQARNMDSQVELTWTNPYDRDFVKTEIYDVTDGGKTLLGSTADETFLITGLENDAVYTILIQTVDGWNNHSEGVLIEVQPIPDPVKTEAPVFYINGTETESLAPGTLKAAVSFKNNSMPEDYSVELILVLLKDGALADINSAYTIVPQSDANGAYTEAAVELEVPDGTGYTAVLYIWDSMTGMESLIDCVEIE